jgi:hypothetical protein
LHRANLFEEFSWIVLHFTRKLKPIVMLYGISANIFFPDADVGSSTSSRRGTLITNVEDQGKLLQYWAHDRKPLEVGVLIPTEKMKIEYWMNVTLQPVPDDEDPTTYPKIIKELWLERLRQVSKGLAQNTEMLGDNFGYQMRSVFNSVRVWYIPTPTRQEGITRRFAEESCARDK